MHRSRSRSRAATGTLALLGLLAVGACRSSTAPALDPRDVAGTYVLEAPADRGPATGTFVLTADGQATRSVHYLVSGAPGPAYVTSGTFARVRSDTLAFTLRDDAGGAGYQWRVRASWAPAGLTLRYPHPADGYVIESYRRMEP